MSETRIVVDLSLTTESLDLLAGLGMLDELADRAGIEPADIEWVALDD